MVARRRRTENERNHEMRFQGFYAPQCLIGGAHHLQGGGGVAGSVVQPQYLVFALVFGDILGKYAAQNVEKVNRASKKLNRCPARAFWTSTHPPAARIISRAAGELLGVLCGVST